MPEGSIGGKYKTIEEADKGIAEMEATLAKITSDRDKATNQIAELTKPRVPAFADDATWEKHVAGKIDVKGIAERAMKAGTYDPKDMAQIGAILREGDDAFIGEVFTKLRVGAELTGIDKAQKAAVAKFGGEQQVKAMLEWHEKNADAATKEAFSRQWNSAAHAETAAKSLFADFTLSKSPRSPGETASSTVGTPPGGFTSQAEIKAAREASKAAHGFDYHKTDTAFLARLAATSPAVKNAPIN